MIHDSFQPPSQKIFNEIKGLCIDTWSTFDNTYGYVDEMLFLVNQIHNHGADVMFLLNMFHPLLREYVINLLSSEARDYIKHYYEVYEEKGIDPERDN
jgi:hypothetical protein